MTDTILIRSIDLSRASLDEIISVLENKFGSLLLTKKIDEDIVNKLEDLEDAKAGEEAYKEYLNSGKKSYPADEVFKMAGIE